MWGVVQGSQRVEQASICGSYKRVGLGCGSVAQWL